VSIGDEAQTAVPMPGLLMWECDRCGHVVFPARPLCPRCGAWDWKRRLARGGVVDAVTSRGDVQLASVRSDAGPSVTVLAPDGDLEAGMEVALESVGDGSPARDRIQGRARRGAPSHRHAGLGTEPRGRVQPRRLPTAEQTIPALLERQASAHAERRLLTAGGLERTYSQVRDAVARSAGMLTAAGVQRGERVAAICRNRAELLDLVLGCAWAGAIAVPINIAARGPQLEHILRNSGPRILAMDSELVGVLETLRRPDGLDQVWALDGAPPALPAGWTVIPAPPAGEPMPPANVGPGDTAAILYTSGTTGPSKGVCCPHAQFFWWGVEVGELLELGPDDVLYTNLPLFHTNALNAFMQALLAGGRYVLGPRFRASAFWRRLADSEATVTYLLGAMITILWRHPPGPEDRAHRVRVALAPASPANLMEPFRERFGVQLVEGYGSTETNCPIGVPPREQRPGYMGRLRDGFEARVGRADDTPAPEGEPGELLLRQREPFAFATGYFGMPAETVAAWRNLWFHTGDRVVREPDGWFRFLDRSKDAIRRRGENISSFEVEQVVSQCPGVAQVAVFGVPSGLGEEEVMAAVVPEPGSRLDPSEVLRFCEPRLAYFAIPRYVDMLDSLPLTENGKVRKAVLRERGVGKGTYDREGIG
jgi:carnitine-CoA ligase